MKKDTQLILALDVTEKSKALEIVRDVADYVDAIKVGYPLVLSCRLKIIHELSGFAPIIADFKVADIPNTNQLICDQVFEMGAKAIIIHGFTGEDSIKACVDTARDYNGEVFVVTEMSHPGATQFFQPIAKEIAELASKCKAHGIVAPATRPRRITELKRASGNLTVISPGVGAQGGMPEDALRAGADYIIVGRSIYNNPDPGAEAQKIIRDIQNQRQ